MPAILATATDGESGAVFLLTEALPGRPATADEQRGDVEALIRALAAGLRAFHDTPVAGCPFRASVTIPVATYFARSCSADNFINCGIIPPPADKCPSCSTVTWSR